MSDLNNKHLPSDIDSLTRRDLVELWLIQFEEHKNMIAEIESLRTQLATAKADGVRDALSHVTGWYDWEWECVSATDLQKLIIEYANQLNK